MPEGKSRVGLAQTNGLENNLLTGNLLSKLFTSIITVGISLLP